MEEDENAPIDAQTEEFQNRQFNSEVSQFFMEKRRRKKHFDLDIVFKNINIRRKTRIPIHKQFLTERCWFFNKMLNPQSNFKEANESSIYFQCHNDLKIFKIFIDYLYSGIIELEGGNVFDIYSFSVYINQQELVEFSIKFLVNNLSCGTLPRIFAFADSNSISKLTADVQTWMDSNFNDVISKSTEVLEWPSKFLIQVLSSTKMKVKREETVLQFVCRWLDSAFDEREQFMQELFQKLRFSFMSTKDINAALQEDTCKGINSKIPSQCSISMNECEEKLSGSAPQYPPEEERHYYEGVYCCGERNGSRVFEHHWPKNKNMPVKTLPLPSQKRGCADMASLNDKLYLIGGDTKPKNRTVYLDVVEMYDPKEHQWSPVASMNIERSYHITCACDGKIYVFGGLNLSNIIQFYTHKFDNRQLDSEVYDPSTNEWSILPNHPFNSQVDGLGVRCKGAAAVGTSIFVLYTLVARTSEPTYRVMEYKTKTNEWSELHQYEGYLSLIGYGSMLLLFTKDRKVIIYDPKSKLFHRLQLQVRLDAIDDRNRVWLKKVVRYRDQIVQILKEDIEDDRDTYQYQFALFDLKTLEDNRSTEMPKVWFCETMWRASTYRNGFTFAVID